MPKGVKQPFQKGNTEQLKQKRRNAPSADKPLTIKQQKAADNFLAGMDKKNAMLKAEYSPSTAHHKQDSVFDQPNVKKYIDTVRARATYKAGIDAEWVLEKGKELLELALANNRISDAIKALEQIGKNAHVMAFKEVTVNENTNMNYNAKMDADQARKAIEELKGKTGGDTKG